MKPSLTLIGTFGAIGVMLGALGAHAMKQVLTPDQIMSFQTGVRYHLIHTLLLLMVFILYQQKPIKSLKRIYLFVVLGILCFSGSIYLLNLRSLINADWLKILGPVTPIGGLLLIAGWILLAFSSKAFVSSKGE